MAIPAIVQATLDELAELASPLRNSTNEVARRLAAEIDAVIARIEGGGSIEGLNDFVTSVFGAVSVGDARSEVDPEVDETVVATILGDEVSSAAVIDIALVDEDASDSDDDVANDYDDYDDYDDEPVVVTLVVTTPDVELTDALADDIVDNIGQFVAATGSDAAVEVAGTRDLGRGVLIEVTNPGTIGEVGDQHAVGFIDTTEHGVVKVCITDDDPTAETLGESILDRAITASADLDELVEIGEADAPNPDRLELRLIADADSISGDQVGTIVDKMGPALAMLGDIVVDGDTVIDANVAKVALRINAHAPGRPALALLNGMGGRGAETIDGVDISIDLLGVTA